MFDFSSTEVRTSWWWAIIAVGFLYFLNLAVRRYLGHKTRARVSIIVFAGAFTLLSVTAILLRVDDGWVHAKFTEARTFLAAVSLWWMILEFRSGNITIKARDDAEQAEAALARSDPP